jgi:hypothetical protein
MSSGLSATQVEKLPGIMDEQAQEHSIRVWNEADDRSLIRLVPDGIREKMLVIPEEIRKLDERALREKMKPTPTDNQLRLSFWLEYDSCQSLCAPKMKMGNVLRGICSEDYFYGTYTREPLRMAWLVLPPVHYTVKMTEALEFGVERMREILSFPLVDKKGRINTSLAKLMITIVNQLEARVHGSVAQKLQIEQKSITMRAEAGDILDAVKTRNMAEIDKRLKYLEKKERMLENGVHPGPISVESTTLSTKVIDIEDGPTEVVEIISKAADNDEKPLGEKTDDRE